MEAVTKHSDEAENPWVAAGQRAATEPTGPPPPVTGAATPQAGVPNPTGASLPVHQATDTAAVWLVGAHGGAGEECLARLDEGWKPARHAWRCGPSPQEPAVCVLVARTHTKGLDAAQRALTQWASGSLGDSVQLLGLALVADAPGRLPRPLRELCGHVAGGAPRLWRVGWVNQWRLGEPLEDGHLPKDLTKIMTDITALTDERQTHA